MDLDLAPDLSCMHAPNDELEDMVGPGGYLDLDMDMALDLGAHPMMNWKI